MDSELIRTEDLVSLRWVASTEDEIAIEITDESGTQIVWLSPLNTVVRIRARMVDADDISRVAEMMVDGAKDAITKAKRS